MGSMKEVSRLPERTVPNPPVLLYINDLPDLLTIRKAALESHGCSVQTVATCLEAFRLLEETSFDAILLDYKHEGMDARAVAFKIKQRFPSTPIILLSAFYEMPESILWLVDEYVMRSDMPEGLLRALDRLHRVKQASGGGAVA